MLQGGSFWTGLIAGIISQAQDHQKMRTGLLNKHQYTANTTKNVTGSFGLMAGVEYGALLGSSILPGLGTAVGAVGGAIIGGKLGHKVGHHAGNFVSNQMYEKQNQELAHS